MNNIKVSICSITYNHAPYIRECLDGFLMQECNFDFEVLIHDDASTDNTAEIIKEYQAKYPDIIKPIIQTENQWSKGVRTIQSTYNFSRAKGKYLALCEGDDYWTDPLKLQKQVDALEQHPNIDICTHPSYRLYGNDLKKDNYGFWGGSPKVLSAEHVIRNYAGTAGLQSILIRNKYIDKLNEIGKNLQGGHSTVQILYSMPNGLYYLPDYMAVYRIGSMSSISKVIFKNDNQYLERQKSNWKGLTLLNEFSDYKFDKSFKNSLRLRAIVVIGTGFINWSEKLSLIREYKLYKNLPQLVKATLYPYYLKIGRLKVK